MKIEAETTEATVARTSALPVPPAVLQDKYRLVRQLGAGGMGVVYEAHDTSRGGEVAVKLLRPEAADENNAARLLNEARAAARIDNEHVVRVIEVGALDSGIPFLVMDLLHGDDFERLLRIRGPLAIPDAVDFVVEALEGIAAAHAAGIIHRDLKPSNLFLAKGKDGANIVKVLDFGICKRVPNTAELASGSITTTGSVLGSPTYMAPEQLRSFKRVDARADIWSVGVILYELLTGKSPFARDNLVHVLTAILEQDPTPPTHHRSEIPAGLEAVVLRCLRRARQARFESARELAEALSPWGGGRAETSLKRIRQLVSSSPGNSGQDLEEDDEYDPPRLPSSAALQTAHVDTIPDASMVGVRRKRAPGRQARSFARPWFVALALTAAVGITIAVRSATHRRAPPRSVALLVRSDATHPAPAWIATAAEQRISSELASSERIRVVPSAKIEARAVGNELLASPEPTPVTFQHLSRDFAVDRLVVIHTHGALGSPGVRVGADLYDARDGGRLATLVEFGSPDDVLRIAEKLARNVREAFGLSQTEPTDALRARASLPKNAEAARKYAEGLSLRKAFELDAARRSLEAARDLEPEAAVVHDALAELWAYLGYETRAVEESRRAVELASELRHDERLRLQARAAVASHDWNGAVEAFRALSLLFPEEWEDALAVVDTMVRAGRPDDATSALAELAARKQGVEDPRTILLRARIAGLRVDHAGALALATEAHRRSLGAGLREVAVLSHAIMCGEAPQAGAPADGLEACRGAIDAQREAGDVVGEASTRARYSRNLLQLGRRDEAALALDDVEARVSRIGPNLGWLRVRLARGDIERKRGHWDKARELDQEALDMARLLKDSDAMDRALQAVAADELEDHHGETAIPLYLEAIEIDKRAGRAVAAANAYRNLGLIYFDSGKMEQAKSAVDESVALYREVHEEYDIAWALDMAGSVATDLNELDRAQQLLEEALAIREKNKLMGGESRMDLAEVLLAKGDLERALAQSELAVQEYREAHHYGEIDALLTYGSALLKKGDAKGALAASERAFAVATPSDLPTVRRSFAPTVAKAQYVLGDRTGLVALERLVHEARDDKGRDGLTLRLGLGEVLMMDGEAARARGILKSVSSEAKALGLVAMAAKADGLLKTGPMKSK
jgi:serine/threonine-protein kinase